MNMENCVSRLYAEWIKYSKIVVAIDFDDTINDFHSKGHDYTLVIELVKLIQEDAHIVVFTASSINRYQEISDKIKKMGIRNFTINDSPIKLHSDKHSKIYFNILLDDRAGLYSAYTTLKLAYEKLKGERI